MSEVTIHIDRLDEVDDRYAYATDDGVDGGSLIYQSENGDTLFLPYGGRWTVLEAVESRGDAVQCAREWEEAAG